MRDSPITLIHADCVEAMRDLAADQIDAIVCDPPYGLGFMGKRWDTPGASFVERRPETRNRFDHVGGNHNPTSAADAARTRRVENQRAQEWHYEWAVEALRVLKPGGHLLAFGGTRTYHRLASAVEDAGFEVRDCIAWLYGQGFPKSRAQGGGWGTALKPAFEPIVVARRPPAGTVAANMERYGTGALNIDGCRLPTSDALGGGAELEVQAGKPDGWDRPWRHDPDAQRAHSERIRENVGRAEELGRWPANVALDDEAAAMLDEQAGERPAGNHPGMRSARPDEKVYGTGWSSGTGGEAQRTEAGGASRFYYTAKASRAERNAGLDGFEAQPINWSSGDQNPGSFQAEGTDRTARNPHPTIKPVDLMRWLVRLVTPAGGTVLDPFAGSGTTGIACALEGFVFVGIEREAEYVKIAQARIDWWAEHGEGALDAVRAADTRAEVAAAGQMELL